MSFDFSSLSQHGSDPQHEILFKHRLGGANESILVSHEGQELWVLKLRQRSKANNRLANELFGAHLCHTLEIPVPRSKAIFLPQDFVDDPRVWFKSSSEPRRPEAGLHFASRYLPQVTGHEMYEQVPSTLAPRIRNVFDCVGIFVFDVWAMHLDERQTIFDLENRWLQATFIDNGEIFGGSQWCGNSTSINAKSARRAVLTSENLQSDLHVWVQRLEERIPSALFQAAAGLPQEWYSGNLTSLLDRLMVRLNRLTSHVAQAVDVLLQRVEISSAYAQDLPMGGRCILALEPDGLNRLYTLP